jgi:predicted NBD/HSP70 family sugar kinase
VLEISVGEPTNSDTDHQVSDRSGRVRGIAAEQLRRHNLGVVLERVHLDGPVSRSELATQTGLNRSTIGDLVGELVDLGLVSEGTGTTRGGRGRPSSVVQARPAGAVVLAVETEVDFTSAATVGLGGHIFERATMQIPPGSNSPEYVVAELTRLAEPLLRNLPPGHNLVGVGAAAAGLVRREDGFVSQSPNRGWTDAPLGQMLAEAFGNDRVRVRNEADVGALAEYRRGAARHAHNAIYVAGAVGVGLGVIHDGTPMLGVMGFAGEAGHSVINPQGRPCRCGSSGCWETEVGQEALARHAGIPWGEGEEQLIDEVLQRAHAGDQQVFAAFREIGTWLGLGVGNLVNIFNPDLVVFGGIYHPLFPFLERWINAAAERSALAAAWRACTICRSELGLNARLVGAAELVLIDVIADPAALAT